MSDIIVICNWDSDSGMIHPISKERLPNKGECYILLVTDKVQFLVTQASFAGVFKKPTIINPGFCKRSVVNIAFYT